MDLIPLGLLNSFITFNNSKNIVEAATTLGITQPALSKQLKNLENILDEPLFLQSGRKKMLTPFGKELNRRLNEKLGNVQDVIRQTQTFHLDQASASIRISGRRGILDRMSSKINFDGSLIFNESSNDSVIKALLKLETDLGIAHSIPNTYELTAKPLFKENFHIAIPKKYLQHKPFYNQTLFNQLRKYPCVGYKPNDEIIKSACAYSDDEMKKLQVKRITENYSSLAEMVNSKIGWSVLPSYLEKHEKLNWYIQIPEKIIPHRQFFIIYRPEFSITPWFKNLVLEIQSCF